MGEGLGIALRTRRLFGCYKCILPLVAVGFFKGEVFGVGVGYSAGAVPVVMYRSASGPRCLAVVFRGRCGFVFPFCRALAPVVRQF